MTFLTLASASVGKTPVTGSQGKQVGDFAREWQAPHRRWGSAFPSAMQESAYFSTASSTEYVGIGIYWSSAKLKDRDIILVQFIFLLL